MADTGVYHVVLSNACGSTPSDEATLTVNRADQVITFDQPLSPQPYGAVFTVSPSASSGLPVSLSAAGSCSLDGYSVTMTMSVGACWLTASQAGDDNYLPAPDVLRMVETAELEIFIPLILGH